MTDATLSSPVVAERRMPPVPILLAAIGILAVLIGLVTPWVDVNVDRDAADAELLALIDAEIEREYGSERPLGITLDDGPLVIVASIAFAGFLAWHHRRNRIGRLLPIAAALSAGVLLVVGVGNLSDVADKSDRVQQVLPVTLDATIGLYLTLAGALLALAGAALAVAKARPKPDEPVA